MALSRSYRIHEFAELAGVTVKALRHYDRLGLLKPRRTCSGYRQYAEKDLERLEQIIALKFLGLPLKQIRMILDRPALQLQDTLRLQRKALQEKQQLLSRAIHAIRVAEEALDIGRAPVPKVLKRIIEAIGMQNDIDLMKKYYGTDEAWEKRRRFYEEGPAPEWRELYRDVNASLGEDPGGEAAQALSDRWLKLSVRAYSGDPDYQTDSITAWMDREHWPPFMKRRIAEFNLEEVTAYIQRAALCSRKKYFSHDGWTQFQELRKEPALTVAWQSRVDLFRMVESALDLEPDPTGEEGRAIAARWMGYLETASGGDPEVRRGLLKMWADRPHWTATVRWVEEGLSMVTGERFENAAAFIDKAVASNPNGMEVLQ